MKTWATGYKNLHCDILPSHVSACGYSQTTTKRDKPMRKIDSLKHLRAAQTLILFGLSAVAVFAQSGNIDTSEFTNLGTTIIKTLVVLAGLAFVGLIIWGGLTLTTNRPRGLAMIGGGLVGALLAGLAFVIVSKLTGNNVQALLLPMSASSWLC
jgi:hypothetical protein